MYLIIFLVLKQVRLCVLFCVIQLLFCFLYIFIYGRLFHYYNLLLLLLFCFIIIIILLSLLYIYIYIYIIFYVIFIYNWVFKRKNGFSCIKLVRVPWGSYQNLFLRGSKNLKNPIFFRPHIFIEFSVFVRFFLILFLAINTINPSLIMIFQRGLEFLSYFGLYMAPE